MAIPDLPVWTIRPNWKGGILERLEWLTDVLASDTGVEQRRSVRPTPRRSFEITVNPTRNERTYLDLLLHRWGAKEWLFPIWHDQAVLQDAALADDSILIFDNRWREFDVGGYAILYRDHKTYEVVEITDQDENGVSLAGDIVGSWPIGTKVYPLRRCTLPADTSLKALTGRVGEAVLLFTTNQDNPYDAELGDDMILYNDSPLLTRQPDRSREITTDHVRLLDELDAQTGLRYRTDSAGRAFQVQSHNWQLHGRKAHADFRSLLYTMRGRQSRVYLPSFNDDLILSRPHVQYINWIDVESVGLYEIGQGSPIPGRALLFDGEHIIRHANFGEYLDGTTFDQEERLVFLGDLPALPAGTAFSFLSPARLDTDTIEIHHHTDSDGTSECGATFRTFLDARDDTGSNFLPIAQSAQVAGSCGTPVGTNPCRKVYLTCGWTTYMIVPYIITDACSNSQGHPASLSVIVPHPLIGSINIWNNGQPQSGEKRAQAGNVLNIPDGTLLVTWNGSTIITHVPLYFENTNGNAMVWYVQGSWASGICPDQCYDGGQHLCPEVAWIGGGVPDPQLNCAAVPIPFKEIRYIGYAEHSWTYTFNQTMDRNAKWEDYPR